jgi:hypothetical protein
MEKSKPSVAEKIKKKIQDTFDVGAEGAASITGELVAESVLSQFLPGATTMIFSYKQKRFEQNIEKYLEEMKTREEEMNKRISQLEDTQRQEFMDRHFGIITDYVIDEPQREKIRYIVNGMVNLLSHESINEDFVLTYYDTLRDLRLVDIGVLRFYYDFSMGYGRRIYQDVLDEFQIEYEQYDAVREKLARIGLLETKRDREVEKLYKNVEALGKYIQDLSKNKSSRLSLDRLSKNDGYHMSKFGRNFLEFFVEEFKEEA